MCLVRGENDGNNDLRTKLIKCLSVEFDTLTADVSVHVWVCAAQVLNELTIRRTPPFNQPHYYTTHLDSYFQLIPISRFRDSSIKISDLSSVNWKTPGENESEHDVNDGIHQKQTRTLEIGNSFE